MRSALPALAFALVLPHPVVAVPSVLPAVSPVVHVSMSFTGGPVCLDGPAPFSLVIRNSRESGVLFERAELLDPDRSVLWRAELPADLVLASGGEIELSATVTGSATGFLEASAWILCRDAVTREVLGPFTSEPAAVMVVSPGRLAVSLAGPARVSLGQQFTVSLTVTNDGGLAVGDIRLSLSVSGGLAGHTERNTARSLAPGKSRTIRWALRAHAAGSQFMAVTAVGESCGDRAICATGLAVLEAVRPTRLVGELSVSSTRLVAGQWITVDFTLTNTGGAPAGFVRPVLLGGSRLDRVRAPSAAPVRLEPGASASFSWTFSTSGAGTAAFSGSASCRDALSGKTIPLGMVESRRAEVLAPARLAIESARVMPEPYVPGGSVVMVSLTVANKGGATATVTDIVPGLQESVAGVLVRPSKTSPTLPFTLEGGETRSVTWNCRAGSAGTALFRVSCSGGEELTGRVVKSPTFISNRVGVQ